MYETDSNLSVYKVTQLNFQRLWILSCDIGMRTGALDENSKKVKDWLDERFTLEFSREIDGLRLFRYVKRKGA